MRAFFDQQADVVAIDLSEPGGAVDGIGIGRATVLIDAGGEPRSVEIVGVRGGVDDAIAAVAECCPTLDCSCLHAAAHAALAAPNLEIEVSVLAPT